MEIDKKKIELKEPIKILIDSSIGITNRLYEKNVTRY